jgi:hypothetical protein
LARAFRLSVIEYLKKKQVPERRVLAAKDIGSIYMKEDAEQTPGGARLKAPPDSCRSHQEDELNGGSA